MTDLSTIPSNVITYPFSIACKGFLAFEHQIGDIAKIGNDLAKANIDPYIHYSTQPLKSYKKVVTSVEAQKIIDFSAEFAVCRLPNHKEAITNVLTQATINFFSGRVKSAFGNNPTAAAIIRDASKLPSIEANVAANNTIGFTENKYEVGSLYASRSKVICKAVLLSSAPLIKTCMGYDFNFKDVARVANYICEVPSRGFNILDKRKQAFEKQNPNLPKEDFLKFASENSDISLLFESIVGSVTKTFASDQLGEIAGKIGYESYIKEVVNLIDNSVIATLLGNNAILFEAKDDIYTRAYKSVFSSIAASKDYGFPVAMSLGAVTFGVSLISGFSGQVAIEIIGSYGLGTPSRICQDSAELAIKNVYNQTQEIDYEKSIKEATNLINNSFISIFLGNDAIYSDAQDDIYTGL